MKSNFEFLNRYWPALAQIGETAENYLYSDPNASQLSSTSHRLCLSQNSFTASISNGFPSVCAIITAFVLQKMSKKIRSEG